MVFIVAKWNLKEKKNIILTNGKEIHSVVKLYIRIQKREGDKSRGVVMQVWMRRNKQAELEKRSK